MKRFVIAALVLLAAILGCRYVYYQTDFFLPQLRPDSLAMPFRAGGGTIEHWDGREYRPVRLRGVEVSPSIPYHHFSDYAASEEDYGRWLEQIAQMGANTVLVTIVMDDDFYNALYSFNTSHDQQLWLVQGITVEDAVAQSSETAYASGFMDRLAEQGRLACDVVHGRRDVFSGSIAGGGVYRADVSPWVAGYSIVATFEPDNIAYTDHSVLHDGKYEGQFFSTEGASAFEAVLATVMDEVASYEYEKYHAMRPIGFTLDPTCDFLNYKELYARQLLKYARVDAEHILAADATPQGEPTAGSFVAYRLDGAVDDFALYLDETCAEEIADALGGVPVKSLGGGYLELLSRYHTMPVVAWYGTAAARGSSAIAEEPRSEEQQGRDLADKAVEIERLDWAGEIVSAWGDVWTARSWNTAFATLPANNYLWHDLQTDTQNRGLMAFVPGERPTCTLDGHGDEWEERDRVLENDGLRLSVRYDAEGLYLLVEGDVSPERTLYVPIDVCPETGSAEAEPQGLAFDRDADFLLVVDGYEGTRLLVHERYDALRENFLYETTGQDPFVDPVGADSHAFVAIGMAQRNDTLLEVVTPETRALQRLGVWETGRLVHGNGDPQASDFNSLTDFCFGTGCVEVRLPWLLLNVGDPANMRVHRDYYENFGVEMTAVRQFWFGVADGARAGNETIGMQPARMRGWGRDEGWHERLKQSYYVMRDLWSGGDAYADAR